MFTGSPSSPGLNYELRPRIIASDPERRGMGKGTPTRTRHLTDEPQKSERDEMHISDTSQVMEALSATEENLKLHEGWSLITVVVTTHPNGQLHPCYILGKQKIGPSHRNPD